MSHTAVVSSSGFEECLDERNSGMLQGACIADCSHVSLSRANASVSASASVSLIAFGVCGAPAAIRQAGVGPVLVKELIEGEETVDRS